MKAKALLSCAALLPVGASGLFAEPAGARSAAARAAGAPAAEAGGGRRYLWFPLHSGASNQLLGVKAALMLGAILDRTVVMPPILKHGSLAYGCGHNATMDDGSWECQQNMLGRSLNMSLELLKQRSRFRVFNSTYDIGFFEVPTQDLFEFYNDVCGGNLSVQQGCGRRGELPVILAGKISDTLKWRSVADVTNAYGVSPFRDAPVLAVGSTFRMRGLRDDVNTQTAPSPRLREVLDRLRHAPVPFSRPVAAAAERVSKFINKNHGGFSAFHLRLPDGYGQRQLDPLPLLEVHAQWVLKTLQAAGVPDNSSVYIATNLREGCAHFAFEQLRSRYNCFSLAGGQSSEDLMRQAGLRDNSLQALTGMEKEDLMGMLDKQVCVLADQGFWPSSGKCFTCSDEPCPTIVSPTYANDIIDRRSEACKPSCTVGPADSAALVPGCRKEQ